MRIVDAIRAKAKEEGGIWFLTKKIFSVETWVVMERETEAPILEVGMKGSYLVRTATLEDMGLFVELGKKIYVDVEEFQHRLRSGQKCYIALDRGKIIYFVWVSPHNVPKSITAHVVKLKPQEVYMYQSHCLPEYRGKRIHSSVMTRRLNDLKTNSIKKSYVDCRTNNVPQVKTFLKHGFKPYKFVRTLTLLGKTFYFPIRGEVLSDLGAPGNVVH